MAKNPLLPSDVVNAAQRRGEETEGLFDQEMLRWFPTHAACWALAGAWSERPSYVSEELWDAALSCTEGQYDPESATGRMPTH